jgi:predicted TIM-barrel fold metal-dependent hydrolase
MKVDVHMHIALEAASSALQLMRDANIVVGLNASGGTPSHGLPESRELARSSHGRLRPLCNIELARAALPDFASYAQQTLKACKSLGALGLKIPKSLGLGIVDSDGALLTIDDSRLDALFDAAGALGLPVLIHSADPKAFFRAPTADNERHAELLAHPGWSFYGTTVHGQPWPSWENLLEAFERRVARHPHTQFLGAHFGNAAEEPERVSRMLARYPNYFIDTAARVPEFGRHPAAKMRELFSRHQDRILFGSDLSVGPGGVVLGSSGAELDSAADAPRFFMAHWKYFETRGRGLAHPTPIQGTWTVDGIGLPRDVLEKLYWRNADRLFSLGLSREQTSSGGN